MDCVFINQDGTQLPKAMENCPDGQKLLKKYKLQNPKIITIAERKLIVTIGVDLLIRKTVSTKKHYSESMEKMC